MKNGLRRLSLSQQFLLVSFPLLLAATLVIGWWIGRQVEDSVVRRIGGVTSLYVDSFVAPHLQRLRSEPELSAANLDALAGLMTDTPLGQRIVSLRIWRPDGLVLFSSDGKGIGQKLPIDEGLEDAAAGNIYSEVSERSAAEQAEHRQPMARLIETYTPVHADNMGRIIAVAEFYQAPDEVDREAGAAQRRSWLLVAGVMLALYLLLFVVVRSGSRTIVTQRRDLGEKVTQLTRLDRQNRQLHERVSRAAEQAISLNENFLRRVSADVHDGPGQDLGFALMQITNLRDGHAASGTPDGARLAGDLERVRAAVQSALTDLRTISGNLEMPDIDGLDAAEIAARVVRDFEAKTHHEVRLDAAIPPDLAVSLRVRITLYRLLQESLANTFHHAKCEACRVELKADARSITIEVSDKGPGFDVEAAKAKGRLGLSGMRQRVEVLGGTFELHSAPGAGTRIRVTLPLTAGERADD